MKEDRCIYIGKTGNTQLNKLGFPTIKELAIGQHVAPKNSLIIASIDSRL